MMGMCLLFLTIVCLCLPLSAGVLLVELILGDLHLQLYVLAETEGIGVVPQRTGKRGRPEPLF